MKLKAYTSYNEYRHQQMYRYFDIIAALPKIGEEFDGGTVKSIWDVAPDCENSDEVFAHELYEIEVLHDDDGYTDTLYVAVPIDMEEIE